MATAVFLCTIYGYAYHQHQQAPDVESQYEVRQEDVIPDTDPISINQGTLEELDLLPGIGPVLAQRIVDYRTEHGLFTTMEGLLEVSGIGEKVLEDIKKYALLNDAPT